MFISIPPAKVLFNYILPWRNGSEPKQFPFEAEYLIDKQTYYVPVIIETYIAGILSMTVFITYDMTYAMCTQHVVSLLEIVK